MRKQRATETPEQRGERLKLEAQAKKAFVAAEDRAVEEQISRNIELYGP